MIKRILSTFLAVIMLMGSFAVLTFAEEGAGETTETEKVEYTYNTTSEKPSMDYLKGMTIVELDKDGNPVVEGAVPTPIVTKEDKLATMDLRFEKDGYRLYVDAYSGEVATVCVATGEILFTNPYNTGSQKAQPEIKEKLLSQIVVKYADKANNGETKEFYSFEETIQGESDDTPYPPSQIDVKNIKNGIRVEYTIGREEARMLLPMQIEKSAFETKILEVMASNLDDGVKNFTYRQFESFYRLQDPDAAPSEEMRKLMLDLYPITKKMDVYILDSSLTSVKKARAESYIKTYCPSYTYEHLEEDHLYAEYEAKDENPPLFKMALEYTLGTDGVSVRLPSNGIRFNESLYQLEHIEILPFMGAGANPNAGYTFYPDGSGALFDFQKIANSGTKTVVTGKIYGQDYVYHEIIGKHQEIVRYPVFGLVETESYVVTKDTGKVDPETNTAITEEVTEYQDRGFFAIVEEGEALMELTTEHEVKQHPFNTVKMKVRPRPSDKYNVADAISVGENKEFTVVSPRKYAGSFKVKYIMLTDEDLAKEKGLENTYDTDYMGMAKAYRDYLEKNGTLTRLTEEDVSEDIPLYIETFGALETTKKVLSIPVSTMAPLTSFEDIKTMHKELSAEGVKNINFILTGYTKGGMTEIAYPSDLKWEKAVGGEEGFEDLVAYAKENKIGIFPDFDFVFLANNTLTDGVSLKNHAVKTIDNRYTSKRVYSATKQTHISYYELAISPAYFHEFYEGFTEKYLESDPIGISVSTLGYYLNSDFDEDEPYNREDSKEFTIDAFKHFDEKYSKVMTSGGNSYSWKYVDYITDVALDSSRYAQAAASVPFLGIVLHGYVQIAGTPINMEGNIDYTLLKAIENGASLNFILSYQNTDLLKESVIYNQYYSVRYDIWFSDVVNLYNELNALLKDLQTSVIVDHKFLVGERVPDADELEADARAELEAAIELEKALKEAATESERKAIRAALDGIVTNTNQVSTYLSSIETKLVSLAKYDFDAAMAAVDAAKLAYDADVNSADLKKAYEDAVTAATNTLNMIYGYAEGISTDAQFADRYQGFAKENIDFIIANSKLSDAVINDYQLVVDASAAVNAQIQAKAADIKAIAVAAYEKIKVHETTTAKPFEDKLINPVTPPPAGTVEEEEKPVSRYISDDNKIILVSYSNGTSFILNFNDYDITTVVNDTVYTVVSYGYVVLK